MTACEAAIYALGGGLAVGSVAGASYYLGRRSGLKQGRAEAPWRGRHFDPDAETSPEPTRRAETTERQAAETVAETRKSLADRIELERQSIAAEKGGPKKGRPTP